jgi:hypothetical protein
MIFNKTTWKERAEYRLEQFKELVNKAGTPVYATVVSLTLMPLIEIAMSSGIAAITLPLMTLISGLGTNLLAAEIERWKDSNEQISETDIIQWVEDTAANNSQLRNEIDEIMINLDAIPTVQKNLNPEDKQWFVSELEKQLKKMGNYDRYEHIIVQGDVVQGDKVQLKQEANTIVQGNVYHFKNVIKNPMPKRNYPWGDLHNENHANTKESEISASSTVGCFSEGASPYGCEELSGNVWEWTRSIDKDYPYKYDDGREDLEKIGLTSIINLRGGSFYFVTNRALCASRLGNFPGGESDYLGFRVVSSPFLTSDL